METTRTLALTAAILVCTAAAFTADAAIPESTTQLRRFLKRAIEEKNIHKVLSCYSDTFASSRVPDKQSLKSQFEQAFASFKKIEVSMSEISSRRSKERAVEVVDVTYVIHPDRGNRLRLSERRMIEYRIEGGRWRITREEKIDTDAQNHLQNGRFDSREEGLKVDIPPEWTAYPVRTPDGLTLIMKSKDLSIEVALTTTPLLQTMPSPSQMAASYIKNIPATEVSSSVIRTPQLRGTTVSYRLIIGGKVHYMARAYLAASQSLYTVTADTEEENARKQMLESMERIISSIQPSTPTASLLAGRVEGGYYVNELTGCRFRVPEGWKVLKYTKPGRFTVRLVSPDGVVRAVFTCIDFTKDVDVSLVTMADEYKMSTFAVDYELLKNTPIRAVNSTGYATVCTYTRSGQRVLRVRAYFRKKNHLFAFLVDTTPATEYPKKEKVISGMIKSLRFEEPEKP